MRVIKCNLWDIVEPDDLMCITVNMCINSKSELVMGKGNALQAKTRFPELVKYWAYNKSTYKTDKGYSLYPFITKRDWRNPSSYNLIKSSLNGLIEYVNDNPIHRVILPMPGCGCGGLDYNTVMTILLSYRLDNRYIIVKY